MSFTGSSIEQVDRQVNLLAPYAAEVAALWEELPEQSIEVLVTAALPAVVGGVRSR
jgi:hypothetical protein